MRSFIRVFTLCLRDTSVPVKMMINIQDIPIMIDRLVHSTRVEDCTRLKRVNLTQQTNWYLCGHLRSKGAEQAYPHSQNFCCALTKQHAHLKNPLIKQNGKEIRIRLAGITSCIANESFK